MNKADIVSVVADAADISKASASRAVEKVFESITTALSNGDVASIAGFGNFSVSERSARQGRNPRTGESIHIAASKSPKFKAGKALKDAVN
ncbi:MAG: HU family DNA-binding protein [Gammaproteobacteria bacterium]|nr:HU family DNA-binding protein [Gammaproteobacteria bacterium]